MIPIIPADCGAAEPFALMVLGDCMAPEFVEGDVVVVEPDGLARDGAFVVAQVAGEWHFRRLESRAGGWRLAALDPAVAPLEIASLACVRGVVIQRARGRRRRVLRHY